MIRSTYVFDAVCSPNTTVTDVLRKTIAWTRQKSAPTSRSFFISLFDPLTFTVDSLSCSAQQKSKINCDEEFVINNDPVRFHPIGRTSLDHVSTELG